MLGRLWKLNFYVIVDASQQYQYEFIIIIKNWKQSDIKHKMLYSV